MVLDSTPPGRGTAGRIERLGTSSEPRAPALSSTVGVARCNGFWAAGWDGADLE